MSDFFVEIT